MLEDRIVFLNGDFVPWREAKVHIMCHSFTRGSAIFEILSFNETNVGPAVFRLDEHLKRLFRTAQLLDMELPLSKDEFHKFVLSVIRRNKLRQGFIKTVGLYAHQPQSII